MDYYDLEKTKTFLISQKALIIEEGRVLLLKSANLKKHWELPGGLLEMEEDLVTGLKREVNEETGIQIDIVKPISTSDVWTPDFVFRNGIMLDARVIIITYVCTRLCGDVQLSCEHSDFRWVEITDFAELELTADSSLALSTFLRANKLQGTLKS